MKTLHDIEQHARELAGGEFEVCILGSSVYLEDAEGERWMKFDENGFEDAAFDVAERGRGLDGFCGVVEAGLSLCSQLDAWIKGDAK